MQLTPCNQSFAEIFRSQAEPPGVIEMLTFPELDSFSRNGSRRISPLPQPKAWRSAGSDGAPWKSAIAG
jgi:hypothetical protein